MYHGSNTMWRKYAAAKGSLQGGKRTAGQPLKPGTAVFLTKGSDRHHVGLYVGDGKVIGAMVRCPAASSRPTRPRRSLRSSSRR